MSVSTTRIASRTKVLYEAANPGVIIDITLQRNILKYLAQAIAEEILAAQVTDGQTVTGIVTVGTSSYPLTNGKTTTKGNLE